MCLFRSCKIEFFIREIVALLSTYSIGGSPPLPMSSSISCASQTPCVAIIEAAIYSRLHVLFLVMNVISSYIAFSQHGFLSVLVKEFGSSALMACSSATFSSSSRAASPGGSPPPSRSSILQYLVVRPSLIGIQRRVCSMWCCELHWFKGLCKSYGQRWRRHVRCSCWRQ